MPKYRVIVPAYTRVEEEHIIEAADEGAAKQAALEAEPIATMEDADYYEPVSDDVRVTEITDQTDADTSGLTLEFDPDAPTTITFGEQFEGTELVAAPAPTEPEEDQRAHAHFELRLDGLTVSVGRSPLDSVFVVEIGGPDDKDCDDNGAPRMRLYINDENTYENPPPPGSEGDQGQPCAFFKTYHHDEESWYVAVSEEEFSQLQEDEHKLGLGNWTPLASEIMDRDHLQNPNLDRCVEIAVC
jgi:hypothetical protein